mmetsp:Transcript_64845/g.150801  ORF Transcript_64845/g.150801 Transcript_64845/m.150801 type:complete len:105 (-) Transcript_64845:1028-1342(-)
MSDCREDRGLFEIPAAPRYSKLRRPERMLVLGDSVTVGDTGADCVATGMCVPLRRAATGNSGLRVAIVALGPAAGAVICDESAAASHATMMPPSLLASSFGVEV